jgi:O-antigen/teichoic acid export membrane protein
MLLNTVLGKSLGILSQIAMGWFLSDHDFGVYAIAISVSTFTSLLRDGGLSRFLIQHGDSFEWLQGPVFWMMLACNTIAALLLAASAPTAAYIYDEPQLILLLGLLALTLPLSAPAGVLVAKLSIDLRFRALGAIQFASSTLRYGGMVVLAWNGFGTASFVVPVLLTGVFEWPALWLAAKASPWRKRPAIRTWCNMFQQSKWILLGTFAIGLMNNGAYFALAKVVSMEVLGIYFFAFQIVLQVGVLLSNNLFQVLFPAFSRIIEDTERSRVAILRSLNIVATAATWVSVILVPIYEPIEKLLWHGKWAASIVPVQILSLCFSPNVALSVVMAVQSARGRFQQWGLMTLGLAVGTILSVVVGAYWGGDPTSIALFFGLFNIVGGLIYSAIALRDFRIGAWILFKCIGPPWLIALGAAGITEVILNACSFPLVPGLQIALGASAFTVVYVLGIRIFRPLYLRQTIDIFPVPLRHGMKRLLWIPS